MTPPHTEGMKELKRYWVSVKKRLPPLEQIVMVSFPSGFDGKPIIAFGARLDGGEGWCWGVGRREVNLSKDCSWNDIEVDDDYEVTHWMPLVRPPHTRALKSRAAVGEKA